MIAPDLAPLAHPIADLELLPQNPRRGDVRAVAASLEAFGQRKPIVARRSDHTVLAGNHTLQAATHLGWAEIAVVWVDDDDATGKAYALADNRTAELGGYDNTALAALIAEVRVADEALLAATGWTDDDLEALLAGLATKRKALTDPDHVPEPPAPISQPGALWQLGPHRVLCADSTDAASYTRLLAGDKVHCIVTDPPYNVAYTGKTKKRLTIGNDEMLDGDFLDFLLAAFGPMVDTAIAGAAVYVFHSEGSGTTFRRAYAESGLLLKQCLIWVKNSFVLGRQDYHWQHEPILYGWKPGAAHRWYGDRSKTTLLDFEQPIGEMSKAELRDLVRAIAETSSVLREAEHPTMKPVRLLTRLLENSTRPGNIVLDPFAGSGSTLIACEQLERAARVIEQDGRYVDVICRRWQEYTGEKPLDEAGDPHDFTGADR